MTNEILVIDDNLDIRQLISGLLHDQGYDVRQAANYDQAMIEIQKKLPDLAIIDVKLDKGDNDSAQQAIKNALADKVSSSLDDRKVDVAKTIIQPTPEAEAPSDENA